MKRIAFAFSLVAATTLAAPLAAQTRSGDGPWWDPGNTRGRTTSGTVDNRGTIYGRNGTVYDNGREDGRWKQKGRDGNGNFIYVRRRSDGYGNVIEDRARRDTRGQYHIIDSRVVKYAKNTNRTNGRIYDDRDGDRNNDGYIDQKVKNNKNDRWAQNNGHDNGKHNGWYKNGKNGRKNR
jgi:hypothetical protein